MDKSWTRGRTIGRGSAATVSVAVSPNSGDIFAVKSTELPKSESLQREQKILSSLSCPHIVGYKGFDIRRESDQVIYNLHLEYAPSGTLSDQIRKTGGRLDESAIGYYTRQIVQGLQFLHSKGLVHCDIKSTNILITENGAKIADFGCAKRIDPPEAVPVAGTPLFMAPEVARGEEQGYPCDIWALGCTFIEMATGGSPWSDVTDPASFLYRIAYSDQSPRIPSFLSEKAKDFLGKCLSREPKQRWTASQLLEHPFLREFRSFNKGIRNPNSGSPTSILDHGFWSSVEKFECFEESFSAGSSDSPEDRIRRLSLFADDPNWRSDEDWITIRGTNEDEEASTSSGIEDEDDTMSCSASSSISCGRGKLLNFLDSNVKSRIRLCKYKIDSAVLEYGNFVSGDDSTFLLESITSSS